jgi:2-dehydro-3-deoxygluconokinase
VDVLTIGETMALFDGVGSTFATGEPFRLRVAGAESNFAIALTRLELPVTWISRLGGDRFGDFVLDTLAGEGLDLRYVERDAAAHTGIFFKWHEGGEHRVLYRRAGSAASRLRPENVPSAAYTDVRLVHLSGITMALSETARSTVLGVAAEARARGLLVTFDPNFRPALWAGPLEAEQRQREILPFVDWYLCGEGEGCLLHDVSSPAELRERVRARGAAEVAVRVGARGALVWEEGEAAEVAPATLEDVVDEVGAGDGFAAGFVYGLLQGWPPTACARAGNVIAAAALRGTGDWETFPRLADVAAHLGTCR